MKKIIYSFGLLTFIILSLFTKQVFAQNIGSLKNVVPTGFSFTLDLQPGDTDTQVLQLQRVLNADVDTTVSLDGDGSRGHETTYFGNQTKLAVIKFQNKYRDTILTPAGLTQGTGIVGQATRTKLNLLIGVMNTYPSVGSPQGRASSGGSSSVSTTYIPPTTVVAPTTSSLSTCSFVELLISIQVITPGLENQARTALGCPVALNNLNSGQSSVDIRVNGQKGVIPLSAPGNVTISWTSNNVTSCQSQTGPRPTSGSQSFYVDTSGTFVISCTGPSGTVTDSVAVSLAGNSSSSNSTASTSPTFSVACQYTTAGTLTTGENISWYASAPGATGPITYVWSGTDSLSATTTGNTTSSTVSKVYASVGTKTAMVSVTSGGKTISANCNNAYINAPVDYTNLFASSTATSTNQVLSTAGNSYDMVTIKQSTSLNLAQKMTLEAWINPTSWASIDPTSQTSDNVIISKGDFGSSSLEYVLAVDNGKLVYSNSNAGIWTCSPIIPLNQWTHVAVAVDETMGQTNLYVNGVQMTNICQGTTGIFNKVPYFNKFTAITEPIGNLTLTASTNSASSASARNLHIGNFYSSTCSATSSKNGFNGKIDDVRIWNIARTTANIASSTKTSVATSTGLVAEYNFDDYSVRDSTSFANNGFQKGSVQIFTDNTSPAFVASVGSNLNYNLNYSSTVSFTDPDGVCQAPLAELPPEAPATDGGSPMIPFAGIVTNKGMCTPHDAFPGPLWQVAIAPCHAGDQVTGMSDDGGVTAMPSTNPIYVVIREGIQSVPNIGDSVRGQVAPDHGQQCKNPISDGWLGTVSGPLGASPTPAGTCDSAAATQAAKTAASSGGGNILSTIGNIAIQAQETFSTGGLNIVGKVFGF